MKELQLIVFELNKNNKGNYIWITIDKIKNECGIPYQLFIKSGSDNMKDSFYGWTENYVKYFKTLAELRDAITTLELLLFLRGN